jgi:hypothetical protein
LTTKDQSVIFERTMKTNHTPTPQRASTARPDPGSYSWKLLLIKDARVHYVVLKQQPRTTHPTHNPHKRRSTMRSVQPGNQKQTSPGKTRPKTATLPGPVASGPNSVPNTKPHIPHPHRSRTRPPKGTPSVLNTSDKHAAAIR